MTLRCIDAFRLFAKFRPRGISVSRFALSWSVVRLALFSSLSPPLSSPFSFGRVGDDHRIESGRREHKTSAYPLACPFTSTNRTITRCDPLLETRVKSNLAARDARLSRFSDCDPRARLAYECDKQRGDVSFLLNARAPLVDVDALPIIVASYTRRLVHTYRSIVIASIVLLSLLSIAVTMPARLSKLSIDASCMDYVHPWTDSCVSATTGLGLQTLQESLKIYTTVYIVRKNLCVCV